MRDPYLTYFGHPVLPAGYNSAPNDGDELDGAGYNEPEWPYLFDSFIPLEVLIITDDMMDVFDGCPDYVAPFVTRDIPIDPQPNVLVLPAISAALTLPIVETEIVIKATDNVIVFPAKENTLILKESA